MRAGRSTAILYAAWVLMLLFLGILLSGSQAKANLLRDVDGRLQVTATPTNTPTFTPTAPTPSATVTSIGNCLISVMSADTTCMAPSTFAYTFILRDPCSWAQGGTVYFEVAPDIAGPWTTYDQQAANPGPTVQGSFTESSIPAQYYWYRVRLHGSRPPLPDYEGQTPPKYICSREPLCPSFWIDRANYPIGVQDQAVTSAGNTLYSFGGRDINNTVLSNSYAYDTTTDTWRTLAPLPQPRFWASAIMMGGLIYVLNGGDASHNATNSVFIYNPVTNTWSQGPDSSIPTYGQSVVNLNGSIYRIGGGYGSGSVQYVNSVYIYGQGFVAPLPEGRAFSSAVALGGYIYLAGGNTAAGIDTKTYRYDPVSNVWEDAPIADMFTARSWAVSGLLNGRWVLASGAFGAATSTIGWDPQMNSWHTLTPLSHAVYNGAGAVAGNSLYVISGYNENGYDRIVQQYDPSECPVATTTATPTSTANVSTTPTQSVTAVTATVTPSPRSTGSPTYTPTPQMPTPGPTGIGNCVIWVTSSDTTCTAPSGFSYIFNLHDPCYFARNGTVYFEVAPDIGGPWTIYDQQTANSGPTVEGSFNESNIPAQYFWYRIRLDGIMPPLPEYVGLTAATYICSREPLCPSSWNVRANYPVGVTDQAVTSDGNTIYSFGGRDPNNMALANSYAYDTATDTWRTLAPLPRPRYLASAVMVGNLVYVFNGVDLAVTNSVSIYDPATNSWSQAPDSTIPTVGQSVVNLNGSIYLIGGADSSGHYISSVYVYGHGFVAPLPAGRAYSSAVALGGYIYLAGGGTNVAIDAKTYRYDPVRNVWEDAPIADMFAARDHAVSGLLNGRWVLAGGAADDQNSTIGWDPQTNSWHTLTPLSHMVNNGGGAVAGGSLYVISGYNGNGYNRIVQQYDPSECPVPTATPTPTACTITFSDVPPGSTFYQYIRCLACLGIVSGYSDGTFRPNHVVTRGQIAKIVSISAGFNDTIPPDRQTFEDIAPGSTFWLWIERMYSNTGLMNGYVCGSPGEPCVPPGNRNYFRPNNNAVRGQIMKVVAGTAVQVLGWTLLSPQDNTFEDVLPSSVFYTYIETAYAHGVVNGYTCGGPNEQCIAPGNKPYFRQYNNTTRGQTSKMVAVTFFPDCDPPERARRL